MVPFNRVKIVALIQDTLKSFWQAAEAENMKALGSVVDGWLQRSRGRLGLTRKIPSYLVC